MVKVGNLDSTMYILFQNIDGLERMAGISEEKLIQAHGTMATAHCMECGHKYSQHWVKGQNLLIVFP